MKTIILTLCIVSAQAYATTIPIDIGPPRVLNHDIFLSTAALSGTLLNGQTISLDYQFSHLLHLYPTTSSGFYIAIRAETNMAPMPNTLYPSVIQSAGYAVGLKGFQGPSISLDGNSGIIGPNVTEVLFGLVEVLGPGFPPLPHNSLYLTGMHFDFTLPDMDGVQITGLQLHIDPYFQKPWNNHWSITDSVPDAGSTISLLALGLMGIAGFRYR